VRTELEQELAELRREVFEGRTLIIRTDNLLKTLHTEMKAFGARQKQFDRRQMLSSGAAYTLFALLAGGAALFLSGARTSAADSERDRAVAELKAFTRSIEKDRAEQAAVAAVRRSAGEAYRMMTDLPGERRLEGVTALAKMDQSKLDPFERQALADRAAALRRELGQAAFERGKEAFRNKDWALATDELSRSLTMEPSESQQIEASFRLGAALVRQHKYEPAITPLKTFLEKDKGSKNREVAMSLLAQAYEQTGNREQAATVARELPPVKRALPAAEGVDARLTTHPAGLVAPPATLTAAAAQGPAPAAGVPDVRGDVGTTVPRRPTTFKTAAESSAGLLPPAGGGTSALPP